MGILEIVVVVTLLLLVGIPIAVVAGLVILAACKKQTNEHLATISELIDENESLRERVASLQSEIDAH